MGKKNNIEIVTKKNKGDKLHNNPKLETIVIRWINEEPSLSNYKIAEKLREEYKFKITSPSIKTWRGKWYDKMKNDVKQEYEDILANKNNDTITISDFHDIPIDKFKNIHETIKVLLELESCMERVKKTFSNDYSETEGENKDDSKRDKYFFDKEKEDVYRGYINEIVKVRKVLDVMLGDVNIYKLVQAEIVNFIKGVVFKIYNPEDKELYERFKKESAEFDTMLRQKYLVKF